MGWTRRGFAGLSAARVAAPASVCAQRTAAVARVGVLQTRSPAVFAARVEALRRGLAELGHVDGQNLVLEYRSAHGKSRFELALNLRTARQLGLSIPASFRLRAGVVIE